MLEPFTVVASDEAMNSVMLGLFLTGLKQKPNIKIFSVLYCPVLV